MPRPTNCRWVCHFPQSQCFVPAGDAEAKAAVVMTVDEYETIRLIDKEGLSQEECCERMQVARTTVQKIYETARKKLADALVDAAPLRIEGGSFRLCRGEGGFCGCEGCYKRQLYRTHMKEKGENAMRIAVTYENGQIFQHFGRSEAFKIYDTEDGRVTASEVVPTNGSGHGALAGMLQALQADVLICGGIGAGAQAALAGAGIRICGGVSGDADAAAEAFAAGKLEYSENPQCGGHHEEGCGCGGHHHEGSCGCGAHE